VGIDIELENSLFALKVQVHAPPRALAMESSINKTEEASPAQQPGTLATEQRCKVDAGASRTNWNELATRPRRAQQQELRMETCGTKQEDGEQDGAGPRRSLRRGGRRV
jgi:hypothetical protein